MPEKEVRIYSGERVHFLRHGVTLGLPATHQLIAILRIGRIVAYFSSRYRTDHTLLWCDSILHYQCLSAH
jgi:hypothetical protein